MVSSGGARDSRRPSLLSIRVPEKSSSGEQKEGVEIKRAAGAA